MKRFKKLTKEQKKAIWSPSEENAGAGWIATGQYDLPRSKYLNRERDTTKLIDQEFN